MIAVDFAAFTDYNAGVEAARDAYDRDTSGLTEILSRVCHHCSRTEHGKCSGRKRWLGMFVPCGCAELAHDLGSP